MTIGHQKLAAYGPLPTRILVGIIFIVHGILSNLAGSEIFFGKVGLPPDLAMLIGLLEVIGGIALLVGVLVRIASILFMIEMIGSTIAKLPMGSVGGYELDLLLMAISISLVLTGPGKVSVERDVLKRELFSKGKELVLQRLQKQQKSTMAKVIFTTLTIGIVFLSVVFSTVYNDDNNNASSKEAYALSPTLLKVRIESPVDGQQVPTGNLQIAGNSTDDIQTDCMVSVALNRKTPYQTAIATGSGGAGANDYSSWTFTFNSSYAVIEPGQNRIAARISCPENPTLVKGTHLNVTGASSGNLPQQTTPPPPTITAPFPLPAPYAELRPPAAPSIPSIRVISPPTPKHMLGE